jgi:RNA polymerase sigma factor (sigma-70 family)
VGVSHPAAEGATTSLVAAEQGRLSEFESLYRVHVGAITAYFARRSSEPQTVADLTADTFVEAIRSFGSFDPERGSARPWLFTIARRVYARHCERSKRQQDAARRHAARQVLDGDEIEELTERIDAERSGRDMVTRLERLPALDREAIELVDVVGLAPKEAAAALEISPGALRVRLFRARARLRKESASDV